MSSACVRLCSSWRIALVVALAGWWAGCESVPPAARADAATVVWINHTAYRWQIVCRANDLDVEHRWELAPHEQRVVTVPPGSYRVTQTAFSPTQTAPLEREASADFVADETYDWELATLHSQSAGPVVVP